MKKEKYRILIVDDSVDNLHVLSQLLEDEGNTILQATNGTLALDIAFKAKPALIILDIKMPGMDGYEVCRKLKKTEGLKDIPVIFISGLDSQIDKVNAFGLGGVDYIAKPFQAEEVLARVNIQLELLAARTELEQRVIERTAELAKSNKMLKLEIEQHQQAENTLKQQERLLRTIAENYPNSFLSIIEKDLKVGYTSGQEFHKLGLDPEKFIGLSLEEVFGDQVEVVRQYYLDTFKGKETSFELYINNQYQLYRTVPLFDDNREIKRILAVVENITERKKTEQKLQESNQRLIDAQAVAKVGSWETNLLNMEVKWSDETFRIFGLDPHGFYPTHPNFLEYVHPEDRAKVDDAFTGSFNTHAPNTVQHRIITPSGELKHVEENWRIFFDENEKAIRAFGTCSDITERKLAEEKLHESEELWRSIVENEPECVKILDRDGRLLEMNPAGLAMIQAKERQVIGKKAAGLVVEEDQVAFNEMVEAVFCGETRHLIFDVIGLEGRRLTLESTSVPLKNTDGSVKSFLGVTRDITRQKQAEKALMESELRYHNIFETAPVSIWQEDITEVIDVINKLKTKGVVDFGKYLSAHPKFAFEAMQKMKVMDVNHHNLQMFGAKSKTELKSSLHKIFTPQSMDTFRKAIVAIADGLSNFEEEISYLTLQGKLINAIVTIAIPQEQDKQKYILVSNLDITERKQAEEALVENEKRLKEAERISHMGSWEMELATGKSLWSDEFFRICGFEPGSFQPTAELGFQSIHPDDRELAAQVVDDSIKTGNPYNIEKRILRPDGTTRWVHSIGEIKYDDKGVPLKLIGSFLDITERRLAGEALQKSEEQYRSFVQNSSEGIYLLEFDQPFLIDLPVDVQIKNLYEHSYMAACNDIMARMFGFSLSSEIIGKRLIEFHGTDDNTENIKFLTSFIQSGYHTMYSESEEFDKEGKRKYFSNNVLGVIENGTLIRIWGSQSDITERKLAEEKLKAQLDELKRWHNITLDREDRIRELKTEVNETLARHGEKTRYLSQ